MAYFQGIAGLILFIFIAYLVSSDKKAIDWKLVVAGLMMQLAFSIILTKVPFFVDVFLFLSRGFVKLLDFSLFGAQFLFGDLAKNSQSFADVKHNMGFIFAFQVLPSIVFFSTFTSGLYYLGILQKVVYGMAWVMSKTMRISGAESLSAAGNIFLGQTEAPLLIKPFIPQMTRSEMLCLMTGGMATIAGGVMAAYIAFLGGDTHEGRVTFAAHLLTASIMNAPAGIVFAKIILPETHKIDLNLKLNKEKFGSNLIDALANGASDGVKLAANVGGMLLAFIAVIALVNYIFMKTGYWMGINDFITQSTNQQFDGLSMQYILGQIYRPVAWLMGVPWKETLQVGSLLGQKTVINEFVSYIDLAEMKNSGSLSTKSIIIATFALCGFSNFSSIAIQMGGISIMAPSKKSMIAELGFKALLAASLACFASGIWAGLIIG